MAQPLSSVLILLTGLFGLSKPLRAFGVTPASLLKTAAKGVRIEDLEIKTSFQMAFERQFRDVTEALSPHRMVIFIDDLDRCHPDRVLQILEAVNFLVSAGDCFVVLGFAKKLVEASVGLAFGNIASEVAESTDGGSGLEPVKAEWNSRGTTSTNW